MDWSALEAIAAAATAIVSLATAIIVIRQIREMQKSTHATAFKAAYDMLQTDDLRQARGFVISVLGKKTFTDWTDIEKARAEKVCQNYDSVGIMCRRGFIPVEVIADSWGDSLRRTWEVLSPLVSEYRVKRNSQEFWDEYEWLANEAMRYRRKLHGGL